MTILQLRNVRLAFPAVFKAQAFGDNNPAYGAKLIIDPASPNVAAIREAISASAKEKWGPKADDIVKKLKADQRSAWVEGPYTTKDGDTWDGFEGNFFLSTRSEKLRPTALDRQGQPVTEADGVIYAGCYVHASVEIYAYDSPKWGRRINAVLRGVKFYADGEGFGGSTAASADEFDADDEEDFV
jgi:hypothetical protein